MLQVVVGVLFLLGGGLVLYSGPSNDQILVAAGIAFVIGVLLLLHAVLGLGRGRHRG